MLRALTAALLLGSQLALLSLHPLLAAEVSRPDWAFFVPTPESAQLGKVLNPARDSWRVRGSTRTYSLAQLEDPFNPPDWYPSEHPPMPSVVAHGDKFAGGPPLLPCALCHLPNGAGHVESASLAGLPADYIERQFADWRSGARRITVGDARATAFLTALKRRFTQSQVHAAARYFASLKPIRWIRVVQSEMVPPSAVSAATLMRLPLHQGASEALGERIVEIPEEPVQLVIRDAHSGFVAFVPKGSIAAGARLASRSLAGAGLPPCTTCHGAQLTGTPDFPALAGRPPTYIVRQLWAFQSGDRHGPTSEAMRLLAAKMSVPDMMAVAAYCASLPPAGSKEARQDPAAVRH